MMKTVKKESGLFPLKGKPSECSEVNKYGLAESLDYDDPNYSHPMVVSTPEETENNPYNQSIVFIPQIALD